MSAHVHGNHIDESSIGIDHYMQLQRLFGGNVKLEKWLQQMHRGSKYSDCCLCVIFGYLPTEKWLEILGEKEESDSWMECQWSTRDCIFWKSSRFGSFWEVACASAAEHRESYGGFELMEQLSCYGGFLLCFDVECVLRGLCGCGVIESECVFTRRCMCMTCCCSHGRTMCLNTWLSSWTIVPRGPFTLHTVWPWGNNVHVLASCCIHCNLQINRTESKHKPVWITMKSKWMRMGKRIMFRYMYIVIKFTSDLELILCSFFNYVISMWL